MGPRSGHHLLLFPTAVPLALIAVSTWCVAVSAVRKGEEVQLTTFGREILCRWFIFQLAQR